MSAHRPIPWVVIPLLVVGTVMAGAISFGARSYAPSSRAALERLLLTRADLPRGWKHLPSSPDQIPGENSAPCVTSNDLSDGAPFVTSYWMHFSRHGDETLWESVGSTPLATPDDIIAMQADARRDESACVAIENAKLRAEESASCSTVSDGFCTSFTIGVAPVAPRDSAPAVHARGLVDDAKSSFDSDRTYSYTFAYGYTLVNVVVTEWGTAQPPLDLVRRAAEIAQ